MKTALLGGALAFALWGAPALAGGGADGQKADEVGQRDCPPELIGTAECPEGVQDEGLGGAGESGTFGDDAYLDEPGAGQDLGTQDEGLGGAGDTGTFGDEGMIDEGAQEEPFPDDDSVGGSGELEGTPRHQEPAMEPAMEPRSDTWTGDTNNQVVVVSPGEERRGFEQRGVSVLLGGGVEGYTGQLAPEINPGPAWGVSAAFKPTRMFGMELGYSGAVNNIPGAGPDLLEGDSANITRHGGSAVATFGIGAAAVQPYLLGGIGIDRYIVNDAGGADLNFQSNTVGNVPVGVGLRTNVGNFTADLRGNYGILFEQEFAPQVGGTDLGDIGDRTPTGRYGAALRLGATF
jgi:hypothetical protein